CGRLMLFSSLVSCGFASGQGPPGGAAPRKAEAVSPVAAGKEDTDKALAAEAAAFFEKKIRPVLVAECYGCHSPQRVLSRLWPGLLTRPRPPTAGLPQCLETCGRRRGTVRRPCPNGEAATRLWRRRGEERSVTRSPSRRISWRHPSVGSDSTPSRT